MTDPRNCIAFAGSRLIAAGDMIDVAQKAKKALDRDPAIALLVFDDATSEPIELDLRGTLKDVADRLRQPEASRAPGRPKLGVVPREVTLLPRHWEWLAIQPGGASVALRKLVEEARRVNADRDRVRLAQSAAYRFMSAMAGNEKGFEEAARALFAGDATRFTELTAAWPAGVRDHARRLAARAFAN